MNGKNFVPICSTCIEQTRSASTVLQKTCFVQEVQLLSSDNKNHHGAVTCSSLHLHKTTGLATASSKQCACAVVLLFFFSPLYLISKTSRVKLRHQTFRKSSAPRLQSVEMQKTEICNQQKAGCCNQSSVA